MNCPIKISLPPTKIPPTTMKNMQPYCNLLNLCGRLNMMAMIKMKNTVNFLNAIKAARGKIVTQYDDKILVVHIIIEYGIISFIASFLILVFHMTPKSTILHSLWTKNALFMIKSYE